MSDTPRTDVLLIAHDMAPTHISLISHARELERELNAANERIKRLEDENNELRAEEACLLNSTGELERRIKRLEEAYEGEIGEQPELLGSNVMGLLKRELNFAQKRIKRLEEAGDWLCAAAAFMGWHDKIEDWNKAKEAKP